MNQTLRVGALIVGVLALTGCTTISQEQYFEVVGKPDPFTGEAPVAYYKMTITGQSRMIGKYSLKAGYMSAEALDTLQGDIPSIPKSDLDEQNIDAIESMKAILLEKLSNYATLQRDLPGVSADDHEEQVIAIARQIWIASLNDPDLFSMGRMETADPSQFRKLVFYANAKPIDLNVESYGSQIDNIIEKTGTLAGAMRERKKAAETKENEKKGKQGKFVQDLLGAETDDERIEAIAEFFMGVSAETKGE